jgi:hypothetical protein
MPRGNKLKKAVAAATAATKVAKPSAAEEAAITMAKRRCDARGPRVKTGLRFEDGTVVLQNPHADPEGWNVRLQDALGTSSFAVLATEMSRIAAFLRRKDDSIDAQEVDAFFAVLNGAKPENEIQAMLVIQMATNHALAMRSAKALSRSTEIPQQDSNALTLNRLQRNFILQAEALAKLQRGGKQKVVVEHVHVYPGGQAIVGSVTHPGVTGGILENGNQPHALEHATTLALAPGGPLPCENPQRDALPITKGERQETLPDAWRGSGIRRTKGTA